MSGNASTRTYPVVRIINPDGRCGDLLVSADSVLGAVREAITRFSDPWWKGPKPCADSVYEISVHERKWRVAAANWKVVRIAPPA